MFTLLNNISMSNVHHGRFGVAGGILNMVRSPGMVCGVAFAGPIFSILHNVFLHQGLARNEAVLPPFRATFWGVLILARGFPVPDRETERNQAGGARRWRKRANV